MKETARELWAEQSQLMAWKGTRNAKPERVYLIGRELMRRTDCSVERRRQATREQGERTAARNRTAQEIGREVRGEA